MNSNTMEYDVERILDRRIREGRVEYYIKWKGYPIEQSSWEPIDNLRRALKSIVRFEKTAKQTSEKRKIRRQKQSGFSLKSQEKKNLIYKQEAKKLHSFMDDAQTILIESDGEIEKRQGDFEFSQINFEIRNLNLSVPSSNQINMQVLSSISQQATVTQHKIQSAKPSIQNNKIQQFETQQEDELFMAKYKDGTTVTFTKKELIKKHPQEFNKIFPTKKE